MPTKGKPLDCLYQPFHSCCNYPWGSGKHSFAIVGTQRQDNQIQRLVALQSNWKIGNSAAHRLQRVRKYRCPSSHTFLNDIKFFAQKLLYNAWPTQMVGMTESFWAGVAAKGVGIPKTQNLFHFTIAPFCFYRGVHLFHSTTLFFTFNNFYAGICWGLFGFSNFLHSCDLFDIFGCKYL